MNIKITHDVDDILDKINQNGLNFLNEEELEFIKNYYKKINVIYLNNNSISYITTHDSSNIFNFVCDSIYFFI